MLSSLSQKKCLRQVMPSLPLLVANVTRSGVSKGPWLKGLF